MSEITGTEIRECSTETTRFFVPDQNETMRVEPNRLALWIGSVSFCGNCLAISTLLWYDSKSMPCLLIFYYSMETN